MTRHVPEKVVELTVLEKPCPDVPNLEGWHVWTAWELPGLEGERQPPAQKRNLVHHRGRLHPLRQPMLDVPHDLVGGDLQGSEAPKESVQPAERDLGAME